MSEPEAVGSSTLKDMAAELAGRPITPAVADEHAVVVAELMTQIRALRELPIKELPPPLAFAPEEDWA